MQENGEASPIWLIVAIVVGFLVIFPLFWCFVVWVISLIGGVGALGLPAESSPPRPPLFSFFSPGRHSPLPQCASADRHTGGPAPGHHAALPGRSSALADPVVRTTRGRASVVSMATGGALRGAGAGEQSSVDHPFFARSGCRTVAGRQQVTTYVLCIVLV